MIEAKFVAKFLRRQADGGVAGGQTMDGKPFNYPNGHRLVGFFGERALDLVFEGGAAFDDGFHLRQRPVGGVVLERLPVAVKGDDAGSVGRHGLADEFLDGEGNDLQDAAFFDDGDSLERLDVVGMDREQ